MRCRTCEYPLWNLRSRICPECGSGFAPSDFDFASSSVRFMCPHCGQAYYGTDERGHLEPTKFDCIACGRAVEMDEMVLLPTEGVAEDRTGLERVPWLGPGGKGPVGWGRTVGWALVQPRRLMRAMPGDSSFGAAFAFALITNGVYALMLGGPLVLFVMLALPRGGTVGVAGAVSLAMAVGVGGAILVAMVWAAVAHGLLRLTGPTEAGIGRTVQAICYASAGNILAAVPCLGFYTSVFGSLWWVVSATLMVMEGQRVSPVRALLAVAGPPLAIFFVVFGSMVASIAASMTSSAVFSGAGAAAPPGGSVFVAGASPAQAAQARPEQTRMMLDALTAFARENGGALPGHPVQLVAEGRVPAEAFLAGGSGTALDQIDIGGTRIGAIKNDELSLAAVALAADSLPVGTAAYRVGDFVFTERGIDPATDDPALWVVVCAPDQAAPGAVRIPGVVICVGRLGGTVTPISGVAFPAALAEQNRLRAQHGLEALPDPATIAAGKPVVGSR